MVRLNKPNPDCYLLAIKKLNLFLDEVLIIEDSDIGYQAAKASGANVFRVKNSKEVNLNNIKGIL